MEERCNSRSSCDEVEGIIPEHSLTNGSIEKVQGTSPKYQWRASISRQKSQRNLNVDTVNDQHKHDEPGKWQLVVVITIAVWLVELAGMHLFRRFLSRGNWLSDNAVTFISLCASLFVLFYCWVEALSPLLTIRIGNNNYGFTPFMVYRIQWIRGHKHWFMQLIESIVEVFEDGLRTFDTPPADLTTNDVANYLTEDQLLGPPVMMRVVRRIKIEALQRYKNWLQQELAEITKYDGEDLGRDAILPNSARDLLNKQTKEQAARQSLAFGVTSLDWTLVSLERVISERSLADEEIEGIDDTKHITTGEEFKLIGPKLISHVSNIKFPNNYQLQFWLASLERHELLIKLKPMQVTSDETSFGEFPWPDKRRKTERLPAKWKVWMLNNIGFYLAVVWSAAYFEPYYNERWMMYETSYWWRLLVNITVVNFVGFYITTPFFELAFSYWLARKPHELTDKEPWRSLNDGFKYYWLKVALLLGMYVGLLIWRAVAGDWGIPDNITVGANYGQPGASILS